MNRIVSRRPWDRRLICDLRLARHRGVAVRMFSEQFDVFSKIGDKEGEKAKRQPSEKVKKLVDEIMSLTVIEAADLCDLCHEKLSDGGSGGGWPAQGRTPFPHPGGMFGGMAMPQMGMGMPMMQAQPAAAPAAAAAPEGGDAPAEEEAPKVAEKKAMVSVKLVGFDAPKKINVIKEVRAFTGLGLKESKELVESVPKVLKKGVPIAEAEEIKTKLEAVSAKIELD
mmetsp:Transcript_908/g.2204  ORF Transcript_908/g.2204 Transcript_908/m.2204 type:complete len:225 (-) Transcript_908:182-856(-)